MTTRGDGSTSNLTGRQIGRYLLQQQIGSGGVATVYRAYDQVDGRSVALKVLLPTADANTINRFRREALTAGALRHPNIVRIFQVGTALQGDVAYIAMELIEGESLSEWLARVGRLRPEESCNLLEPIARALGYAHEAGVVHRDVKPSNILLRPASPGVANSVQLESLDYPVVPLLTDFGVARAMDAPELTNAGRTVGTPAYMAPEQCAGNRVIDGRADIYSLGTVLYRCVVGRLPFTGTTTQILHAHVYSPLTIDDATLRQLPPVVVDIMRHSLAKLPDDRFATAGELADELALAAGRRARPVAPDVTQGVSDATATLTLSALPATPARPTERSVSVLVPATSTAVPAAAAPGSTQLDVGTMPAARRESPPAPPLLARLEQLNWIRFSVTALLVMAAIFFLAVLALTLPDLLEVTPGFGPVARISGTPTSTVPPTQLAILVAPSATPTQAADDVATGTTVAATQPATTAATAAATTVATASPGPSPTPAPTMPPTARPTATPAFPAIAGCPHTVDDGFAQYILRMDNSIKAGFLCPESAAVDATARLQRFEYGFMLQLANDDETYVYYDIAQRWERADSTWNEGDPPKTGDFPPPRADLFQPEGAFGQLWASRRAQLGYATTAQPIAFGVIEQSFPGGALVRDEEHGTFYVFLRTRRQS